jgi:hypothetical protein
MNLPHVLTLSPEKVTLAAFPQTIKMDDAEMNSIEIIFLTDLLRSGGNHKVEA